MSGANLAQFRLGYWLRVMSCACPVRTTTVVNARRVSRRQRGDPGGPTEVARWKLEEEGAGDDDQKKGHRGAREDPREGTSEPKEEMV